MNNYESFAVYTANALEFTCKFYKVSLSKEQNSELMDIYKTLPAFNDVKESLLKLQENGFRLYAFSNGQADAVEMLLDNAGIRDMFLGVVSVDDIKTFKPSPKVYKHFLQESKAIINDS